LDPAYLDAAVQAMQSAGVVFAAGLADVEIERAETAHGFRFPPDLRSLLQRAVPTGARFPNWRRPDAEDLAGLLRWPADSMFFDVEHDQFWLPAWGPKPTLEAARDIVDAAVRAAPFLIPVFGHRYLPATPCLSGNPVFSVYQTDIIRYGVDLQDYLRAEFGAPDPTRMLPAAREIEFWTRIAGGASQADGR